MTPVPLRMRNELFEPETLRTARRVFVRSCAIRRRKLPIGRNLENAGSFSRSGYIAQQRAALDRRIPLLQLRHCGGRYKLAAGVLIDLLAEDDVRGRAPSRKQSLLSSIWRANRYRNPCTGARGAGRCASEVQH